VPKVGTLAISFKPGRSVDDIVCLLTILARQDERDAFGLPADGVRYREKA
jgi:hypothetical protein